MTNSYYRISVRYQGADGKSHETKAVPGSHRFSLSQAKPGLVAPEVVCTQRADGTWDIVFKLEQDSQQPGKA